MVVFLISIALVLVLASFLLRKMSIYCEFGNEVENNIGDQFVSKCRSTNFRRHLLTEKDITIST